MYQLLDAGQPLWLPHLHWDHGNRGCPATGSRWQPRRHQQLSTNMRYPRNPGLVPTSSGSFGPFFLIMNMSYFVSFYDRDRTRSEKKNLQMSDSVIVPRGLCWVRDIIPGPSAVVVSVRCAEHVGPGLKHSFDWNLIGIRWRILEE